MVSSTLYKFLETLREQLGLSLEELASKIDMPVESLSPSADVVHVWPANPIAQIRNIALLLAENVPPLEYDGWPKVYQYILSARSERDILEAIMTVCHQY